MTQFDNFLGEVEAEAQAEGSEAVSQLAVFHEYFVEERVRIKQSQVGKRSLRQAKKRIDDLLARNARPRRIERAVAKLSRVEAAIERKASSS
jgi:hypothetical protein